MASFEKKVQIKMSTFIDMYKLIGLIRSYELDENVNELLNRIEYELDEKINTMQKHDLYTKYKMGNTEDEKEKARLEYLEKVNIHKDWRY